MSYYFVHYIAPYLNFLLSGFAIVFKMNPGLPENRNKTPNIKSVGCKQGMDYLCIT